MAKSSNGAKNSKESKVLKDSNRYYRQNLNFLLDVKREFWLGDSKLTKFVFAIVSIIYGFILWIKSFFAGGKITAEDFDTRMQAKASEAKKRVFGMLGIDQEQVKEVKPIFTTAWEVERSSDGALACILNTDKSGKVRSSLYNAAIYLFSIDEIFIYNFTFSMIEDYTSEISQEYFYKDIVSVEVKQIKFMAEFGKKESSKLFSKFKKDNDPDKRPVCISSFRLITTSGWSESSTFVDSKIVDSINSMKQLIREKKAK